MDGVAVEIRSYSGEVTRHLHDFDQIILPCAGRLDIEIGAQAGFVAGGVASYVAAGSEHAFMAQPSDMFIVLDAPAGMVRADLSPFFPVTPDMQGLIDFLAARGQASLAPAHKAAWAALALGSLARPCGPPDPQEIAVRKALAFMQERLADPIRVADIARAAGVSPSRQHEAFVRKRGTTPHARLVALRLDAATRLLAQTQLSLAEIAIRTGHGDQSALTRIMRRERQTTPGRLRRDLRDDGGIA